MKALLVLVMIYAAVVALFVAPGMLMFGAAGAEIPEEILECITDADCEYEAEVLCEAGHLEWCVEVA